MSYSWQFFDEYANPLSPSVLANEVSNPTKGALQLTGLRAFKDPQGYQAVGGRCVARASVTNEKGVEEQLRFASKYFYVVVRDTEPPFLPNVPEDSELKSVKSRWTFLFSMTTMSV